MLNVQAYEVDEKGDKSGGTISWSADVDILGGGQAADTLPSTRKEQSPRITGSRSTRSTAPITR